MRATEVALFHHLLIHIGWFSRAYIWSIWWKVFWSLKFQMMESFLESEISNGHMYHPIWMINTPRKHKLENEIFKGFLPRQLKGKWLLTCQEWLGGLDHAYEATVFLGHGLGFSWDLGPEAFGTSAAHLQGRTISAHEEQACWQVSSNLQQSGLFWSER